MGFWLLEYGCFVGAILLYCFAPPKYDGGFCNACFIIYLLSIISFFKIKKKHNYFDFDTIFIITSILMFYLYPIVIYPTTQDLDILLFGFDENKISKGTAMASVGMCSYLIGSCRYKRHKYKRHKLKLLNGNGLITISAVCFILWILVGGWMAMKSKYHNEHIAESGAASYLHILSMITLLIMVIIWFNNEMVYSPLKFRLRYIPKLQLSYVGIFILMLLSAGSRGDTLQIALCVCGLYTALYRKASLKLVLVLMGLGIVLMFGILIYRSQSQILASQEDNPYLMFTDLVVVVRNSFDAISYVEKNGVTYGISMLSPLLSAIPFLQSILLPILGISPNSASSAYLLTAFALGEDSKIGVGSNTIADLYLAFGIFGVIVGMYVLGRFIAFLLYTKEKNIYHLVSYGVMMSYSIFILRAEYFYFIRALVWSMIIIYLIKYNYNLHNTQQTLSIKSSIDSERSYLKQT